VEPCTATSTLVSGKLNEIGQSIAKVTDIVAEIAASASEQSAGIVRVNKAVTEIDKVMQQNAASSQESSSAAAELASQSEELAAMVGSFRMDQQVGREHEPLRGSGRSGTIGAWRVEGQPCLPC